MVSQSYMDTISTISFWTLTIRRFTGWWVTMDVTISFFCMRSEQFDFHNFCRTKSEVSTMVEKTDLNETIFAAWTSVWIQSFLFCRRSNFCEETIAVTITSSSTRWNNGRRHAKLCGDDRQCRLQDLEVSRAWCHNQPIQGQTEIGQWWRMRDQNPPWSHNGGWQWDHKPQRVGLQDGRQCDLLFLHNEGVRDNGQENRRYNQMYLTRRPSIQWLDASSHKWQLRGGGYSAGTIQCHESYLTTESKHFPEGILNADVPNPGWAQLCADKAGTRQYNGVVLQRLQCPTIGPKMDLGKWLCVGLQ